VTHADIDILVLRKLIAMALENSLILTYRVAVGRTIDESEKYRMLDKLQDDTSFIKLLAVAYEVEL